MGPDNTADLAFEIRKALLMLALKNARRSIVVLLAAGYFVAWLGWKSGSPLMTALIATLSTLTVVWRFRIAQYGARAMTAALMRRAERELGGNALLAGVMWSLATLCIYHALRGTDASAHIVVLAGSAAIAAHFLTLVPFSYSLLVVPSIGALAIVSVFSADVRSYPVSALAIIYAVTLLAAGREYRKTAVSAIEHALSADRAMASLQRAKQDAEAGAMAKSQFVATMSHEIRTPMNGVLGSLELLRHSGLNAEQQRLARIASSCGTTLLAILDDVLDHSKIEAGKLSLSPVPTSLHDLVGSVASLFEGNADAKGLYLHVRVDDGAPDWVVADGQRLKQVLLNLVSNAIKFTDRGGVDVSVQGRALGDHGDVLFEVRDTGVGMSASALTRLFAPFTQLEQDGSKARQQGTGLGLSISQRIAEAMGGRIDVESEPGRGTRFFFALRLPLYGDEPPPFVVETAAGALDGLHPMQGTALVAEDDPVNRMIARTMLEQLGLDVVEAADGAEALALGAVHRFDIVFMDCQMPKVDGYGAASKWREREKRAGEARTPIVALTANAFEEDVAKTRQAGMDAHLCKPFTRKQLQEQIRKWL
jgi:signal transduction histidine kinase/CheY-like chemotaxis protein